MEEPAHDYARVTYGGKTVNKRTKVMLEAAAKIFGKPFTLTQGSYNKGVSASAGTHDGGGVVDINTNGMTDAQRKAAEQALRKVGFFAWVRVPPAFAYHIHAVAIGDKEMSNAAKAQVTQGFQDRNGLANHGPDAPADPYPAWVDKYGKHVSLDRPAEPKPPAPPPPAPKPEPGGQMKLVTRARWGGPATIGTATPVRQGIAVHYDGGAAKGLAAKDHSACTANVKAIHNYHLNTQKWAGIGYAWLICPHGYVYEGRGFDRTQAAQPGGNSSHQSVQFMLGGDERPTPAMYEAWYQLRDHLYSRGVAKNIRPHSSWIATTCPGTYLRARITDGTLAKEMKPAPAEKPWIWADGPWRDDVVTNSTKIVQKALNEELGTSLLVDGKFGPVTKATYAKWQQKLGLTGRDADGTPGPWSLRKLGEKRGFEVRVRTS